MSAPPKMSWPDLLSERRLGNNDFKPEPTRSTFVQDYDRIVFCAPFRRLANKTQVQPLYAHDHVHHRLIHSIEVSSVGRSISNRVGSSLINNGELNEGQVVNIANIVQAACVAHDIGNPPFGHSGETAMGEWFERLLQKQSGVFSGFPSELISQFAQFEGNAQGFRILSNLEMYRGSGGMQLSHATLGAFSKYPVSCNDKEFLQKRGEQYVGLKKFGFFEAERKWFSEAAQDLGLFKRTVEHADYWVRHPLVFLVEAADDITYGIIDLEDSVITGELPFEVVRDLLFKVIGDTNKSVSGMIDLDAIAYLRALSIGAAVGAAHDSFLANYDLIMQGKFSSDLIASSHLAAVFKEIKDISRQRIYTARRKTELEISGKRIISNVLSGILPIYDELAAKNWNASSLSPHTSQLVRALSLDLRAINDATSALHGMADFVSGMTDRYALQISRMLSGT